MGKKGAKKKDAGTVRGKPLIDDQASRMRYEVKRLEKLGALKKVQATIVHERQREIHALDVERAKYSEARDAKVSRPKLKERKSKRKEIDKARRALQSVLNKEADALGRTDAKLNTARRFIATVKAKPMYERRVAGARYRDSDDNKFFVGGRRPGDVDQGADYAFRVADLMRSRAAKTSRQYDTPLRHTKGAKKGQLQYKGWKGGLLERNTKLFAKIQGKDIDLLVKGSVTVGGEKHAYRRVTRIRPLTYDDIIRAMTDTVKSLFREYGSNVSYTISEVSFALVSRKAPVKKGTSKRSGKGKAKGRVPAKQSTRNDKKRSAADVGNRRKRK